MAKSSTPSRGKSKKTKSESAGEASEQIVSEGEADVKPVQGATLAEEKAASVNAVDPQLEDTVLPEEPPTIEMEKAASVVATDPQLSEQAEEPAPPPEAQDPEPVAPTPATEPTAVPQRSGSGFFPMLLGGLLAGLIGYGIAYMQFADQDTGADLAARIDDLETRIEGMPAAPDLAPIEGQISDLAASRDQIAQDIAGTAEAITQIEDRLSTVEKQPSGDGTLQEAAVAAYERELEELRGQMSAQQDELRQMTEQAIAELEATRSEAQSIENNAVEAARNATARASLARVQSALETGAPLGAAIGDLETALGEQAPGPLIDIAESGVPTLASLQADFPSAARDALRTARSEGQAGESGGFGGFLRNTFDVRSTTPQEGDSVDAVLSRAEAAVGDGRLNDALAELAALPDEVRAAMSGWLAAAESRAAAIDAADRLATTLNAN